MPELPELQALAEGLTAELAGRTVTRAVAWSPATVRTIEPPLDALHGAVITGVSRRGKLMLVHAGALTLVMHLMSSGRLGITATSSGRPPRSAGVGLVLDDGRELRLRELSTRRRATAHLLPSDALSQHPQLAAMGPEPMELSPHDWRARLTTPAGLLHTALREGRRVAGVGRCYASELMWAARLAPLARTDRLPEPAWDALARAADVVLGGALERARQRITTNLPDREARVTVVHGHHGEPCLRCGTPLSRIGFAEYELVYCAPCQTDGRVYADRRMSRLLR